MADGYDYDRYGAFKGETADARTRLIRVARRFGLRNRYIRFLNDVPRDGMVVELGCGDGAFLKELRAAGFADVRGVELSPSYAAAPDVHIGDAETYLATLAPRSIDCIVALDVFEHVAQDRLRTLLRVAGERLKPAGRIVFRVPNMGSPLALPNHFGDLSHVTAFNEVSVRQLAFEVGQTVVALHPEPLSYPRSLRAVIGIALWPLYRSATKAVLAAFGIGQRVLTPNLVAVLAIPEGG